MQLGQRDRARRIGDVQLAVRMSDVAGQFVPRRVGLIPTTAAPRRAAAASQNRYSGRLSISRPMWNGPGGALLIGDGCTHRRGLHELSPAPALVAEKQSGAVVVSPRKQQLGHAGGEPTGPAPVAAAAALHDPPPVIAVTSGAKTKDFLVAGQELLDR